MKDGIHQALLGFTDFIYAIVFAVIVRQSFDEIIGNQHIGFIDTVCRILLLAAVFYFLAWDWILGRILTLRNPYQSYTRFFFEVCIAVCAYGAAASAVKGQLAFVLNFSALLLLGALWARRTQRQVLCVHDGKELCVIQTLQSFGSVLCVIAYFDWKYINVHVVGRRQSVLIVMFLWVFIFFYELAVPRYRGISAGPGVPFLARPIIRRIRRFCFFYHF